MAYFMSSQREVELIASTYMKKMYMWKDTDIWVPCSHMIAACQHRCVDFRLFVEGYTTLLSPTMTHGQAFSIQYSMKMSGLFIVVRRLYHLIQCNPWEVDVLDQPGCIMRWTLGRGKPRSHVGYVNN